MGFAEKVRELLKTRRLSQTDLAEAIGTRQQVVSRWLESDTPPKSDYLLKLARALGVTADYLIDDAQDEAPGPSEPVASEDELYTLRAIRALGLSYEEAIRRLAGKAAAAEAPVEPGGKGVQPVEQFQTLNRQDLSEMAQREAKEREQRDKKRRLGFKLEGECEAGGRHLGPTLGRWD